MTNYWMCGGTSAPNQGQLESGEVGKTYHRTLMGVVTDNYVPWMALVGHGKSSHGCFVALDHLGCWTLSLDRAGGQTILSSSVPNLVNSELPPGGKMQLPLVTLGVFQDLEDMGQRVYDWQYEYMWDYTNSDFYARTKWPVAWFPCSPNLQEQFTARLAGLDMDADLMRTLGMEQLWDDAGWSKYPGWPVPEDGGIWAPTFEGPDYAETLRYLNKMGMKWNLWMAGRPTIGLLNSKVGSWGDFQYRADGIGNLSLETDRQLRERIEQFLTTNPRSSFHTCNGGSTQAHQFDIQRLADINYLSDMGRGDQTNYYFSYLETPDKWLDGINIFNHPDFVFAPENDSGQLTMAPVWGLLGKKDQGLSRMLEIYRYLREQGVAGRWSYMMHPLIKGDTDYYYNQRTSYDRKKACIILKHKAPGEVTIYPRGLLSKHKYLVTCEVTSATASRTGADLMANGIVIRNQAPGELIYLGLPNFPGRAHDTVAPTSPGQVFVRRETNIGHPGIALHWSNGSDNNWISYYEVRRGVATIGKVRMGTYYFDHDAGWSIAANYAVRTVDGSGNASDWTAARPFSGGSDAYAALGGHSSTAVHEGWSAEVTSGGLAYLPMTWVAPPKIIAGDLGGKTNQPGGVEGYWEGTGGARVGRGWQRASTETTCVRTWTAPNAGKVRILGRAMKEAYRQAMGKPLHVKILRNNTRVWPNSGWAEVPINNLVGAPHDFNLDVAAGDKIQFVLDQGDSPDKDIIAWMPRIVYSAQDSLPDCSVIRIFCGSGKPYTDRTGNEWPADKFYAGGKAVSSKAAVQNTLPTTEDQPLYRAGRQGKDFSYSIPVKPGLYTVRLKFAETQYKWSFERPFNVSINGRPMLSNFDICQAARGAGLAHERVFRNIVPDAAGNVALRFTGGFEPNQKTNQAIVQAIEVLPQTNPAIRIDVGSHAQFIDWNSFVWSKDTYFEGGNVIQSDAPLTQATPTLYDQALYQTARSGKSISYSVPISPGLYSVHLKFAELWLKEAGQRPMNIEINGRPVRENWDPAQAAGQTGMAADIRAEDITPNKDGKITIHISATGANDAILQGIEIE